MTDDLTLPSFLIRHGTRMSHEAARNLASPTGRAWAPIRQPVPACDLRPTGIFVGNPGLPVTVNAKVKKGTPKLVARYANLHTFMASHPLRDYPIARIVELDTETSVLVNAKPWIK
jgi:hypothetical protein